MRYFEILGWSIIIAVIFSGCISEAPKEKEYYYTGIVFTEQEGESISHEVTCYDKIISFEEDYKEECINCDGSVTINKETGKKYNSKGEELRYETVKVINWVDITGQKGSFVRVTNYKLERTEC
jgi:hypothetical protein